VVHSFLVLGLLAGGGFDVTQLAFFGGLAAIMYFVLIRPQQKQVKDQQAMIAALKKGDDVITQGGIFGKIVMIADKTMVVEVAPGVKLKILKSSVQVKGTLDEPEKKADDSKKEEVK
jgi:preprotein translocase subunit YajC